MVASNHSPSLIERQVSLSQRIFSFSPTDKISILLDKMLDFLLENVSSSDLAFSAAIWATGFPALIFEGSLSSWEEMDCPRIHEFILFFCANLHPPVHIQIELSPQPIGQPKGLPC